MQGLPKNEIAFPVAIVDQEDENIKELARRWENNEGNQKP